MNYAESRKKLFAERLKKLLQEHKACPKCNRTKFYPTLTWGVLACKCGWGGTLSGLVKEKK